MPPEWSVLWVGDEAEARRVRASIPGCAMTIARHPLEAVWLAGSEDFDAVLFSLSRGPVSEAALSGVRAVAPRARILVSCRPVDEPLAREALASDADEYLIEPVVPRELLGHVQGPAPRESASLEVAAVDKPVFESRHSEPAPPPPPSVCEITALSELLRNLSDGVAPAVARLAVLIRNAFRARGVSVRVDEHCSGLGDTSGGELVQPVERDGACVGEIRVAGVPEDAANVGRLTVYARLLSAVAEQARERETWCDLAYTDEVTSLRNRRYFNRELARMLERARERRLCVTVLLFDIDHFKQYNDDFGHDAGDEVLREVAVLLTRCTRDGDLLARYGGDEFVVVFREDERPRVPGSRHPSEPVALTARFQRALGDHPFKCLGADAPGQVTISGGLASFPWNGTDAEQLLLAADQALLAAKRSGRNRIELAGGSGADDLSRATS